MRRVGIAIVTLALSSVSAQAAQACRVMGSPEQRIADSYRSHADLKVALVRIGEARHLSNEVVRKLQRLFPAYEAPWRVTASVERVFDGSESPELLTFDRNWGSAACDDGTPMPRRGDRWIVYYTYDNSLKAPAVFETYPLAAALKADPRLQAHGS